MDSENKSTNIRRDMIQWEAINKAVKDLGVNSGYIIEGFPRNPEQIILMEVNLLQYDVAVDLYQPEDVIIAKAMSRLICSQCDSIYNTLDIEIGGVNLPKVASRIENICDNCGKPLEKRPEDQFTKIKRRYFEYQVNFGPIQRHFTKKNKYLFYEVVSGINDFKKLVGFIDEFYAALKT